MYAIRSIILGSTPIRTTSRTIDARRQLFNTPTTPSASPINITSPANETIDMDVQVGTMVRHIADDDTDRSELTGVVLRPTVGPSATTLDVLWNSDGDITSVNPAKLRLLSTVQLQSAVRSPDNASQTNSASSSLAGNATNQNAASSSSQATRGATSNHSSKRGFRPLLNTKIPKQIRQRCPLDSISPAEIEIFQIQMDNFLSQGHPRIRMLLTGDLESPLLTHEPYIDYMHAACAPGEFVFDHASADSDIISMRKSGENILADECESLLDNPPYYDGFRPCNSAVYFAMISALKPDDMYILRDVKHGDGIRLRNKIWTSMTGDARKSKKLMAMTMSKTVADVSYRFVRHGVSKYFAEIVKTLSKLKSLGVARQDWEVFSTIFDHMSAQCEEFRQVVSDLRDQLEEDEDSVTLKSIEAAFQRKETVHQLGVNSKGTPIKKSTPMVQPPDINVAAAKPTGASGKPQNPQQQATAKSKLWPEMTAEANYGPKGSHGKGECKYYGHRFTDDHCWSGCSKCGGCKEYHKRRRLMDEGKQLCTVHKYATHLESNCNRHKYRSGRGRGRGKGQQRGNKRYNNRDSSNKDSRQRNDRSNARDGREVSDRRYHAKSVRDSRRSRSHSRSRTRSRSRSRSRRSRRHRSHSPTRTVSAHYTKPRYLSEMEAFARGGRDSDRKK